MLFVMMISSASRMMFRGMSLVSCVKVSNHFLTVSMLCLTSILVYIDIASHVSIFALGCRGPICSSKDCSSLESLIYDGIVCFRDCRWKSIQEEMWALRKPTQLTTGRSFHGDLCIFTRP